MPEVLAPLVPLALVLFLIAVAVAIAYIMGTIGDVMRGIPVVGGYLADAAKSIGQAISGAAGYLENQVDHLVGVAWHWMARYFDRTLHHIEANAELTWRMAKDVAQLIYDHTGLRAITHDLTRGLHGIEHRVRTLEKEWHGIDTEVKSLERAIAQGIGHDLRIQIKALERDVAKIDHKVIPAIRSEVDAIPRELADVEAWVGKNFVTLTKSGLIAATLAALGYLGLSGLNCNALKNILGNRGCGLWNGLEDILGLLVDTALLANVCNLIGPFETIVGDVATPVVIALTDIGAGICAGSVGAPAALPVPHLHLPANPAVVLNLP
jgi:hypothetical protein